MKNEKLIILIYFVFASSLFATPLWYHNLTSNEANTYLGYGSGSSENEAKQNALLDISGQISTVVKSEYKGDKKLIDGTYTKDISEQTSQKTNSCLSDFEVLKVENSDLWYVAIKYENRASIDKFIQKIKALPTLSTTTQKKENSFLSQTLIGKELQSALGFELDFKLFRKDTLWYIKYEDTLQILSKKDFEKFFVTTQNPNLTLTTNKKNNILKDKESYHFMIDSKQDGYVTLLDTYEDGTIGIIAKNLTISKDKEIQFPEVSSDVLFEASILEEGKDTFDLYTLIYSKKPLILDRFAMSESELIKDERYKNFDELIELLDGALYSSLKVVTKAK
jgi:hypothetical protein